MRKREGTTLINVDGTNIGNFLAGHRLLINFGDEGQGDSLARAEDLLFKFFPMIASSDEGDGIACKLAVKAIFGQMAFGPRSTVNATREQLFVYQWKGISRMDVPLVRPSF